MEGSEYFVYLSIFYVGLPNCQFRSKMLHSHPYKPQKWIQHPLKPIISRLECPNRSTESKVRTKNMCIAYIAI